MGIFFKIAKNIENFFSKRKISLRAIWKFPYIKMYLFFLFIANISLWISAYLIFRQARRELIVLHYNVDFGVSLVGDIKRLFIIPVLGLVIIVLNFFIVLLFSSSSRFKFIGHLLLAPVFLAHLFLLASLASLYLINF